MSLFHDIFQRGRLFAKILLGHVFLTFLYARWLWVSEHTPLHLAIAAFVGVMIVLGLAWLQAAAFATFQPGVTEPFHYTSRRLPKVLALTTLTLGLGLLLSWLGGRESAGAAWFHTALWSFFGLVLLLLAPWVAEFSGVALDAAAVLRHPRYWLGAVPLLFLATVIPFKLVWWAAPADNLLIQLVASSFRFSLALLMGVAAWMGLAGWIARIGLGGQAQLDPGKDTLPAEAA